MTTFDRRAQFARAKRRASVSSVAVAALFVVGAINPAPAQDVAQFYKGKNFTIVVGSSAGGG